MRAKKVHRLDDECSPPREARAKRVGALDRARRGAHARAKDEPHSGTPARTRLRTLETAVKATLRSRRSVDRRGDSTRRLRQAVRMHTSPGFRGRHRTGRAVFARFGASRIVCWCAKKLPISCTDSRPRPRDSPGQSSNDGIGFKKNQKLLWGGVRNAQFERSFFWNPKFDKNSLKNQFGFIFE